MPILAWSVTSVDPNARLVMNSDTVKPMPATPPMPAILGQVAPCGSSHNPRRTASHVKDATPASLPSTRPSTMPTVTGDRRASPRAPGDSSTPALASANTGTMTKLVHGRSSSPIRSATDTRSRTSNKARRADAASSDPSERDRWRSGLGPVRPISGRAGANMPITTPAMVAWIPDSNSASQNTTPTTR